MSCCTNFVHNKAFPVSIYKLFYLNLQYVLFFKSGSELICSVIEVNNKASRLHPIANAPNIHA
jgi:hypothetical protein